MISWPSALSANNNSSKLRFYYYVEGRALLRVIGEKWKASELQLSQLLVHGLAEVESRLSHTTINVGVLDVSSLARRDNNRRIKITRSIFEPGSRVALKRDEQWVHLAMAKCPSRSYGALINALLCIYE